jgi:transcriptional regulator with GAF, ATPase, and Fis domain
MRQLYAVLERVASTDVPVLIEGETGTGKELVAEAVHQLGPRKAHPLIKINCAALPPSLAESELFGHEKGAFTGAQAQRKGRFELADGGTLFLDEVGELSQELQAKLLRVLQDGTFQRVGGDRTQRVDVRVIAATNRTLSREVAAGRFREDLWYRLNVFPITVPPLRQRKEDIPVLAQVFVERCCQRLGKPVLELPHSVVQALQAHDWPGNVRELQNAIEQAVLTSDGRALRLAELSLAPSASAPDGSSRAGTLEEVERAHILQVLESASWKLEGQDGAAALLGLKPSTLRSRMAKLGIQRQAS